jgi:hypothetical protein
VRANSTEDHSSQQAAKKALALPVAVPQAPVTRTAIFVLIGETSLFTSLFAFPKI